MPRRLLFLLPIMALLLAWPASTAWAQGVLYGRVSSTEGGAVEYATVGVVNATPPYGTLTDSRGNFSLTLRSTDSVVVRVSASQYATQELHLQVAAGSRQRVDVQLKPQTTQLDEVIVTDDKTRNTAFTQIDVKRIENQAGPSQEVESLLKTLPDVSSSNELSSQYSVRGGSFDENLVYINGVEVYRPQLVRSGQQEGLSIVNPDLVDHLLFSPGGFDATCGDRLSSVLDITYSRPVERKITASLSLLGGSLSAQGRAGDRWSYAVGLRHHDNRYLLKSLDVEGNYTNAYTDLQGVLRYRVNDSLDLSLLAVLTRNVYGLVPYSSTTTFGDFNHSLELHVYFDGQETDRYGTLLGAFSADYHPNDDWQVLWTTSVLYNQEQESYDIQDQYWLYEVGVGEVAGDTNHFDRGVGTFLEHARNRLDMGIYATEVKAVRYATLGNWNFGLKAQMEQVWGRMREWKWVDSAGYSFPTQHLTPGVDDTTAFNPLLQLFCNANNHLRTLRGMAYAQREVNLYTRHDHHVRLVAGLRGQYYTTHSDEGQLGHQALLSPRLSASYQPNGRHDVLYRLAAGVYQQPYLYREIRRPDGSLCPDVPSQCSYQATGTVDWNLRLWDKPFRLTADLYYKYITHLIPYSIDNLRIRYNPDLQAVGYATGLSLRINGDFVPGLESWASLSLLKTQEDIEGDGLGWLSRPTDQRFSFKIFLQDYVPTIPWWRMSLSLIYGTGTPVTFPYQTDRSNEYRLPSYFRVDWGNTIQLGRFDIIRQSSLGRFLDNVSVSLEVYNLFNYRNVVSYIWVADYSNIYYPVPNYLTARQLNLRISATF